MSETITPTEADLARDLRADLEAYQERAALVDEIAMHSGCTDYACYCHFILPAALRRARVAARQPARKYLTSQEAVNDLSLAALRYGRKLAWGEMA